MWQTKCTVSFEPPHATMSRSAILGHGDPNSLCPPLDTAPEPHILLFRREVGYQDKCVVAAMLRGHLLVQNGPWVATCRQLTASANLLSGAGTASTESRSKRAAAAGLGHYLPASRSIFSSRHRRASPAASAASRLFPKSRTAGRPLKSAVVFWVRDEQSEANHAKLVVIMSVSLQSN